MTNTMIQPIPGHPRYRVTEEAEAFGPRGKLQPFLIGKVPAISTSAPKCTIYLPQMAALIFFGPPEDDEILEFLDGNPANWRLDNLEYRSSNAWWWSRNPTALEVEYARLRNDRYDLLRVPAWYRRHRSIERQSLMRHVGDSDGWGPSEEEIPLLGANKGRDET